MIEFLNSKRMTMLNVVFASDDNYVPFLSIAIFSLLKNNADDFDEISIFVLDDDISDENKTKVSNLFKDYDCSISFIETKKLDEMDFNVLGLERNLNKSSLTTYARLFMSTLLPSNIDKVLYLDCDSLIVGSYKELWNIDVSNYYCAGVLDGINTAVKESLGFNKNDNYINAGFLLVNLKKWREKNVEEKFIRFMVENQNRFYQHDQGVINNIFKNNILIINPKYNLQIYFQTLNYDLARKFTCMETEYYTEEIVDEARENPVFLHFCGPNYDRPWYNKHHPYAKMFKEYAEKADYGGVVEYLDELPLKAKMFYKGMNNKGIELILKIIPAGFVRKLVNKNALRGLEEQNEKAQELDRQNLEV